MTEVLSSRRAKTSFIKAARSFRTWRKKEGEKKKEKWSEAWPVWSQRKEKGASFGFLSRVRKKKKKEKNPRGGSRDRRWRLGNWELVRKRDKDGSSVRAKRSCPHSHLADGAPRTSPPQRLHRKHHMAGSDSHKNKSARKENESNVIQLGIKVTPARHVDRLVLVRQYYTHRVRVGSIQTRLMGARVHSVTTCFGVFTVALLCQAQMCRDAWRNTANIHVILLKERGKNTLYTILYFSGESSVLLLVTQSLLMNCLSKLSRIRLEIETTIPTPVVSSNETLPPHATIHSWIHQWVRRNRLSEGTFIQIISEGPRLKASYLFI